MADLTVQEISLDGIDFSLQAADSEGDTFENSGKEVLKVKNADSGSHTVTIDSVQKCNQGYTHDEEIAVPAGEERIIGPFKPSRFNSNGKVSITYDDVTSVTVGVARIPEE